MSTHSQDLQHHCQVCRTPTDKRCACCHSVYYCGLKCQEHDWDHFHRLESRHPDQVSAWAAQRYELAPGRALFGILNVGAASDSASTTDRATDADPMAPFADRLKKPPQMEPLDDMQSPSNSKGDEETTTEAKASDEAKLPAFAKKWRHHERRAYTDVMGQLTADYQQLLRMYKLESYFIEAIQDAGYALKTEDVVSAKVAHAIALRDFTESLFSDDPDRPYDPVQSGKYMAAITDRLHDYVGVFVAPLELQVQPEGPNELIERALDGFEDKMFNDLYTLIEGTEVDKLWKYVEENVPAPAIEILVGTHKDGSNIGVRLRRGSVGNNPDTTAMRRAAEVVVDGAAQRRNPNERRCQQRVKEKFLAFARSPRVVSMAKDIVQFVFSAILIGLFAAYLYRLFAEPNQVAIRPDRLNEMGTLFLNSTNTTGSGPVNILDMHEVEEYTEGVQSGVDHLYKCVNGVTDLLNTEYEGLLNPDDLRVRPIVNTTLHSELAENGLDAGDVTSYSRRKVERALAIADRYWADDPSYPDLSNSYREIIKNELDDLGSDGPIEITPEYINRIVRLLPDDATAKSWLPDLLYEQILARYTLSKQLVGMNTTATQMRTSVAGTMGFGSNQSFIDAGSRTVQRMTELTPLLAESFFNQRATGDFVSFTQFLKGMDYNAFEHMEAVLPSLSRLLESGVSFNSPNFLRELTRIMKFGMGYTLNLESANLAMETLWQVYDMYQPGTARSLAAASVASVAGTGLFLSYFLQYFSTAAYRVASGSLSSGPLRNAYNKVSNVISNSTALTDNELRDPTWSVFPNPLRFPASSMLILGTMRMTTRLLQTLPAFLSPFDVVGNRLQFGYEGQFYIYGTVMTSAGMLSLYAMYGYYQSRSKASRPPTSSGSSRGQSDFRPSEPGVILLSTTLVKNVYNTITQIQLQGAPDVQDDDGENGDNQRAPGDFDLDARARQPPVQAGANASMTRWTEMLPKRIGAGDAFPLAWLLNYLPEETATALGQWTWTLLGYGALFVLGVGGVGGFALARGLPGVVTRGVTGTLGTLTTAILTTLRVTVSIPSFLNDTLMRPILQGRVTPAGSAIYALLAAGIIWNEYDTLTSGEMLNNANQFRGLARVGAGDSSRLYSSFGIEEYTDTTLNQVAAIRRQLRGMSEVWGEARQLSGDFVQQMPLDEIRRVIAESEDSVLLDQFVPVLEGIAKAVQEALDN